MIKELALLYVRICVCFFYVFWDMMHAQVDDD